MKRKIGRFRTILLVISSILMVFFILGALFFRDSTYGRLAIMTEVIQLVRNNYVDEVDFKIFFKGAFDGLLESLDTESAYLTKEEYEYFKTFRPNKYGLYIAQRSPQSVITVSRVIPDSPAFQAGIRAGASLISINDHYIGDISLLQARYLIGKERENLNLSFLKDSSGEEINIELKPAEAILEKPITNIIEENYGYIIIPHLLHDTSKQVSRAITYLNDKGVKGIIIDLRDNCFGTVSEAIKIADYFLDHNIILRIQSKEEKDKLFHAMKTNTAYHDFIAVLVNAQTIGASEALTAAIKYNNRGKIIGEQTFGLGVEHTFIELPSSAAIRIPKAKFFTPKGEAILPNGVIPDITISEEKEEHIFWQPSKSSQKDMQFEKALEEIKKLYDDWKKQNP